MNDKVLGTLWQQFEGDGVYQIMEPGLPYVIAGREYDDADYRRGQMFYWGIYGDGVMMPATRQGWAKSPGHAQRAAIRALREAAA